MSRLATQQFFNEYFGHNPPIARNCIDQAYDRLKRTLPDDIIDVRHTEDWAVGGKSQTRSFSSLELIVCCYKKSTRSGEKGPAPRNERSWI